MSEAHGEKFPPVQKVFPYSGMPFNSRTRLGCLKGSASESLVRSILFLADSMMTYHTVQLSEHMMYLNALGQPIIVFNSLKAAFDLLDRRANIYSDRPRLIVADEIFCGGLFLGFMSYGEVLVCLFFKNNQELIVIACSWRRTRRAAHENLTKVVVRDYHPVFFKEAVFLASAILKNPYALDKHFQRSSASATMSILYDYPTLENENDVTIAQIHAFADRMSAATAPGAHLVELFPWMIHIPEMYGYISLIVLSDHI